MAPRLDAPADLPSALDFDREWHRAASEDGRSQRGSRNVVRTIYSPPHGSGMTDTVRLGQDALVNVINCVVPRAAHWTYADQEPLITLRASLACDVEFRYGSSPALVFNRPELTLTCIPPRLPLSAHIAAGARQQGIVAVFRARSFASRFGLLPEDLPPELHQAIEGAAGMGRIASFPIDHRVAALVADTLDSRLHGELRTVRSPSALGMPDLTRSQGVAGYAFHQDSVYTHLTGSSVDLVLAPGVRAVPRLVSANAAVQSAGPTERGYRWQLAGEVPLSFTLAEAADCRVMGDGQALRPTRGRDGHYHYRLSHHAAGSIEAICRH